jgi:hypothetical protein
MWKRERWKVGRRRELGSSVRAVRRGSRQAGKVGCVAVRAWLTRESRAGRSATLNAGARVQKATVNSSAT